MLLREKIDLAAPGEFSGRACFSALRNYSRQLSASLRRTQTAGKQATRSQAVDPAAFSPELHGLLATLHKVRQRILANTLLQRATSWSVWLLAGLIVVAAASARLGGALLFLGALGVAGAATLLYWTWRNRPSSYETAQRLDRAAGLKDRVSTAIFLGGVAHPGGLIAEQR